MSAGSAATRAVIDELRSELPTVSKEETIHWLESLGVDTKRTMSVEIVFRSVGSGDEARQETFLKVKRHHYVEGKAWVDSGGNVATETIYVPVTHLGVGP